MQNICKLCNHQCKLKQHSERSQNYYTEKCYYAKYLEFDEKTMRQINSCSSKIILNVFQDLLSRDNNQRIAYISSDVNNEFFGNASSIKFLVTSKLYDVNPDKQPNCYHIQITNLIRCYEKGQIELKNKNDLTLAHCLLLKSFDYQHVYEKLKLLCEFDYLKIEDNKINYFLITEHGYNSKIINSDFGFIAISFDKSCNEISKSIANAINNAGYTPVRVDQYQHNNNIVLEIINKIKSCKFLVCDLSLPNNGAYFEAGLAYGLGRQVIFTCKKNSMDTIHFDVKQFNIVSYNNLTDLESKLYDRIKGTAL